MKLTIDSLSSITGWTASAEADITGLNEIPDYINGLNTASLVLHFDGINSYCQKVFSTPFDVTQYNELTINVCSVRQGKHEFRKYSDFNYKIEINDTAIYYLASYPYLVPITIDISDITSITKIKITALTSSEDYLIISNCIVVTDEFPIDAFTGIKEQLEYDINAHYLTLFSLGVITASINDTSITFASDVSYIDRYSVIYITDGVNSEKHCIEQKDGLTFKFNSMFDGKKIKHNYVGANVYLYFPITWGEQKETFVPSITIWGIEPEKAEIETDLDIIEDTYKSDYTSAYRQTGKYFNYQILMDAEARSQGVLQVLSKIIKTFLGREIVYINGHRVFVDFSGRATAIPSNDVFNVIPKIQYICDLTIKEDVNERIYAVPFTTVNYTYTLN